VVLARLGVAYGAAMTRHDRWPGWVYDAGEEPDYRFSLANERTFLAWIRTSMALLAGAVVLDAIEPGSMSDRLRSVLTVVLLVLGLSCAVMSWLRWARVERAMRRGEPLPSASPTAWLALVLVLVAALLVAFVV
jgi:putative membrane protein